MATDTQEPGLAPELELYRLTADQFAKLIEIGIFPEGHHVELIAGVIVNKMTKNPPHNVATGELHERVLRVLPAGWFASDEKSIRIGPADQPEPDLIVVRGRRRDYLARNPGPADIALVGEVADTSYRRDRGVKWRRYAACGVPTYWIVDLAKRQVEVHTGPSGRGKAAGYRECTTFGPDDAVPVVFDGAEVGRVPVREILPG